MTLIGTHKAHGVLQVLWVMEFHVDPDMLREAPSEELGLLIWREVAGVRHSCLKGLLVVRDGGRDRQTRQFR